MKRPPPHEDRLIPDSGVQQRVQDLSYIVGRFHVSFSRHVDCSLSVALSEWRDKPIDPGHQG